MLAMILLHLTLADSFSGTTSLKTEFPNKRTSTFSLGWMSVEVLTGIISFSDSCSVGVNSD